METNESLADRAKRAASVISEFDQQGWHRTGTAVDDDSAAWLAERVSAFASSVSLEPFELQRVDPVDCSVDVDGETIPATPAFDGSFLDEPLTATVGPLGGAAAIGVTSAPPGAGAPELDAARRDGSHQTIVVVTNGGRPGLAMRNAPRFLDPFGPPVLYVSNEYEARLLETSGKVTVRAAAGRSAASALNVVADVEGTDPELAPIVVMTPRSGWWYCAAERGGGIACWVETVRRVASERPRRRVRFIATSGHELDHLGLDAYLDAHPEEAASAAMWLHLGASIGAADGRLASACSDDGAEGVLGTELEAAGCQMPHSMQRGWVPGGESRNIHERGWRYISLLGGSPYFHLESDRWPIAVDIDSVSRFALAAGATVIRLSNSDAL